MAKVLQRCRGSQLLRSFPSAQRRCLSSTRINFQEPWDEVPTRTQRDERRAMRNTYSEGKHRIGNNPNPATRARQRQRLQDDPFARHPQTKARRVTGGIDIEVDGQMHTFSPILLRDLCSCSQCKDPSTNQKYRPTTDIPAIIQPREVARTETGVSILWDHDASGYGEEHWTEISTDTLRDYVGSGMTGIAKDTLERRALCDAQEYSRLSDISYDEYMQSDEALYRALRQLHTHGLAFLTGVPESEKSVSTIAERIGPVKNTFYGYTWDVRSVPEAKNVAYTSQDLGFHMDLLYMEQPPHLQFLHCIRSSSAGGASLFTDSLRSASDLLHASRTSFSHLASHPVSFHYNHPSSALYHQTRNVFECAFRDGGKNTIAAYFAARREGKEPGTASPIDLINNVSWSPPFQAPFERKASQNEDFDPLQSANFRLAEWHAAAQKFNELIHREEVIYERLMKPGECVLFDNRRVLHARKAFEVGDVGKERWLRGAYLDKDPYMSKLRVLEHQLGKSVGEQQVGSVDYFEAAAATA